MRLATGESTPRALRTSTSCRTSRRSISARGAAELEVTAVSIHAYAYLTERTPLLPHGASMGDRYGPRLVARRRCTRADVRGRRIAIPGPLTTAYLALRLYEPDFIPVPTPFDQIEDAVLAGDVDLGLLIHEGQLTFADRGLHLVADMGAWWFEETGLPLPLGGNVIRKGLRVRSSSPGSRAT